MLAAAAGSGSIEASTRSGSSPHSLAITSRICFQPTAGTSSRSEARRCLQMRGLVGVEPGELDRREHLAGLHRGARASSEAGRPASRSSPPAGRRDGAAAPPRFRARRRGRSPSERRRRVRLACRARSPGAARLARWPIGSSAAQPAGVGRAPCASGGSPRAARCAGRATGSTRAEPRRSSGAGAATASSRRSTRSSTSFSRCAAPR